MYYASKPGRVAKLVGGSVVVYTLVAACSAAHQRGFVAGAAGEGDAGTGTLVDAMLDAIGIGKDGAGPVPAAEAAQSGTRLKAQWYVAADGAKQVQPYFYDSARKEQCTFQLAPDGKTRCMPSSAYNFPYFSDASCTIQLSGVQGGCAAPAYGYVRTLDAPAACAPAAYVLRAVTGRYAGNAYQRTGSSCTVAPTLASYYDLYSLGAEIPPASFVEAVTQVDP